MFTGIIKGQAEINVLKKTETDLKISVDLSILKEEIKIGDSIAIDGVCLTVSILNNNIAEFDLMNETLNRTNYRNIATGYKANVESSLTMNDKLDGHIVYGDVDSTGVIKSIETVGESIIYTISYPSKYTKYLIDKGRITLDGASLTVIESENGDSTFAVSLIPHSLKLLNIANKKIGDVVNLEYDTYAKIIYRQRGL